jgi:NAD(P)-dependent dehydrogenase (short-subunit alcohol dehydrogenase family)
MARLDSKVALITGGESGIGLATARAFVAAGARVHLAGLARGRLEEAVAELGPGDAAFSVTDVTQEDQVALAVQLATDRFGGLDILFSNAGISGDIAPIAEYPADVFRRVLDVHVLGAFHVLKHGLPVLRDGGSVIINSSVVGLTSDAGICAYATAKHAQVGLMRTAAKEAAARGIRVNTVHPGPTDTAFQRAIEVSATGATAEVAARLFEARIPLGRHACAEEIARSVLFLASADSSFVTGAALAVDGGMHI